MSRRQILIFNVDEECSRWALKLPDFNQRFIDDFKAQIPAEERRWDNVNKTWSFTDKWKLWAMNLASRCFPDAEVTEEEY